MVQHLLDIVLLRCSNTYLDQVIQYFSFLPEKLICFFIDEYAVKETDCFSPGESSTPVKSRIHQLSPSKFEPAKKV